MSGLTRSMVLLGLTTGLLAYACNKPESREKSTGGALQSDRKDPNVEAAAEDDGEAGGGSGADGASDGDADAGESDGVGEDSNASGEAQLTGETIETCTSQRKSWIAVVDGGNSPPACGEALVSWCCTRQEIKARFPTYAAELESRFATILDAESYKLYHCSHNGAATAPESKTTFHFAKVVNGRTCYKTVFVAEMVPAAQGTGQACPAQVKTSELTIDGPACDADPADSSGDTDTGTGTSTGTGTGTGTGDAALKFVDDVKPILAASCSGGACHNTGSTTVDASLQFLNDEAAFKAKKAEVTDALDAGTMPPAASGKSISDADQATISSFLDQP